MTGHVVMTSLDDVMTRHRLPVGASLGYNIPDTGADGTRFWAKYGCNNDGRDCLIGNSSISYHEIIKIWKLIPECCTGESQQYWPNPPGGKFSFSSKYRACIELYRMPSRRLPDSSRLTFRGHLGMQACEFYTNATVR